MDYNSVDTAIQRGTLCKSQMRLTCKVKAADGYTYYMAEALLDTVLGKLATEEAPAYEILEKLTREKIWNIKSMSRCLTCTGDC